MNRYKQEQTERLFQQYLCQYSEREKHHEIISSALWERKEILQYKHTNGLRRDLKEDC